MTVIDIIIEAMYHKWYYFKTPSEDYIAPNEYYIACIYLQDDTVYFNDELEFYFVNTYINNYSEDNLSGFYKKVAINNVAKAEPIEDKDLLSYLNAAYAKKLLEMK